MNQYLYILKVWLSTITAAPLLFLVLGIPLQLFTRESMENVASLIAKQIILVLFFGIGYGFWLFLPVLILGWVGVRFLQNQFYQPIKFKAITTAISVFLIFTTLILLSDAIIPSDLSDGGSLSLAFLYSICLTTFGFLYPISSKDKVTTSI